MVCLQSPSNCCHQNYLNRSSSRWLSPNNLTNMRLQLTYLFAFIIRSYLRGERAQSAEVKVRINVHKISGEILSNIINYFKLPRMRCPSSKSNYNHVVTMLKVHNDSKSEYMLVQDCWPQGCPGQKMNIIIFCLLFGSSYRFLSILANVNMIIDRKPRRP